MTNRDGEDRKKAERERRGKLLRDAIKSAELTQDAFAKRLGMDRSAINQMARGKKGFGSTVAARFTKDLGLPDDYFDPPAPEEQEDLFDRLQELAAVVVEQGRATSTVLGVVVERLARIEELLGTEAVQATTDPR